MTEEIDNIAYRFSLTPVLAHLDRYDWYSRDEVEELLERDDTVYQFNCSAFAEKKAAMKTGAPLDQGGTGQCCWAATPTAWTSARRALRRRRRSCVPS